MHLDRIHISARQQGDDPPFLPHVLDSVGPRNWSRAFLVENHAKALISELQIVQRA
ncbi:MAG: hypothetical protein WB716_14290 [Candidatus Acidiferrales bacterium]